MPEPAYDTSPDRGERRDKLQARKGYEAKVLQQLVEFQIIYHFVHSYE